MKKTILITGCRGGFGRDSAIALAKRGHKVIATTKTVEEAEELNKYAKEKKLSIDSFKLDVTSVEDRKKALDFDIDVLINNAGTGESGSLAEIDINKVRNNFEVNLFGPLELTQPVLKNMMKKNNGTVIFISSLAGRINMPFLAPYVMTKHSISSGIETLRFEMKRITKNIHIVLIEPGAYNTGFNQESIAKKYAWMDNSSYFYNILNKIKKIENLYFNFTEVKSTRSIVKKIIKATEVKKPRARYTAPWWQAFFVRLQRIISG